MWHRIKSQDPEMSHTEERNTFSKKNVGITSVLFILLWFIGPTSTPSFFKRRIGGQYLHSIRIA